MWNLLKSAKAVDVCMNTNSIIIRMNRNKSVHFSRSCLMAVFEFHLLVMKALSCWSTYFRFSFSIFPSHSFSNGFTYCTSWKQPLNHGGNSPKRDPLRAAWPYATCSAPPTPSLGLVLYPSRHCHRGKNNLRNVLLPISPVITCVFCVCIGVHQNHTLVAAVRHMWFPAPCTSRYK